MSRFSFKKHLDSAEKIDDNKIINIIKYFDFNNKLLTVYGTIDNPLFKAKEIAKMIGYDDIDQAIINVDEEDKEKVTRQSGGYEVYINKRGFKTLLLKCDKVIKPEFLDFLKDNLDIDIDEEFKATVQVMDSGCV